MNQQASTSRNTFLASSTALVIYAGLLCLISAIFSISFSEKSNYISIWTGNAILLIFIFRSSTEQTWSYFTAGLLANAAANYIMGATPLMAAGFALSNSIEILLPILLVPRQNNQQFYIQKLDPPLVILSVSIIIGCLLSAITATALTIPLTDEAAPPIILNWFTVDLLALMTILPLGLAVTTTRTIELLKRQSLLELFVVALCATFVTWVSMFYIQIRFIIILMPMLYSAFRLGLLGTSIIFFITVATYICALILSGTTNSPYQSMSDLISYSSLLMCITLVPAFLIAVLIEQRDEVEKKLRQTESLLKHQAAHDPLTGLLNRREAELNINLLIKDTRAAGKINSLLFVDLDNFKIVNDTAGHAAGDELLRRISLTLSKSVRSSDTVARIGGDEFAVILPECAQENAILIAHKLIDRLNTQTINWEGASYQIGASIGVVSFKPGEVTLKELLHRADTACYLAKTQGGNRVVPFIETNQHSNS